MIGLILAKKIASLFLMIFMGYLAVKIKLVRLEESRILSVLSIYLLTPAMIIQAFQVDYSDEVRNGLFLAIAGGVVFHLVSVILSEVLGKAIRLNGVEKASIVYSNAGNLIIPLVSSLFGKEWIIYTSGFVIVLQTLLWTHGITVMSGQKKIEIRKIFTNVNIITVAIGLLLFFLRIKLPDILMEAIDPIGSMIGPVAMLTIGMLIAGMDMKKALGYKRAFLVIFLRLIVSPLIAVAVFKLIRLPYLTDNGVTVLLISLLAGSAPTASLVTQMTQTFSGEESDAAQYAASISIISTLLCIVTMPLMVTIYQLWI